MLCTAKQEKKRTFSSLASMVPDPSVSKRSNASRISCFCSSVISPERFFWPWGRTRRDCCFVCGTGTRQQASLRKKNVIAHWPPPPLSRRVGRLRPQLHFKRKSVRTLSLFFCKGGFFQGTRLKKQPLPWYAKKTKQNKEKQNKTPRQRTCMRMALHSCGRCRSVRPSFPLPSPRP